MINEEVLKNARMEVGASVKAQIEFWQNKYFEESKKYEKLKKQSVSQANSSIELHNLYDTIIDLMCEYIQQGDKYLEDETTLYIYRKFENQALDKINKEVKYEKSN